MHPKFKIEATADKILQGGVRTGTDSCRSGSDRRNRRWNHFGSCHVGILNMSSEDADKVKESVKDYYGKRLKTSDDLQTNACKFEGRTMSPAVKSALKLIHEEVSSK